VKIFEAQNVSLSYGRQKILDKLDISLKTGSISALIGPNGAGKSSAFRILAGLVKPDAGELYVDKKKLNNFEDLRKHCGYLLESPDFYPYLSGKKNLELLIALSASKANATQLLELVGLGQEVEKKVQKYSRGMKQRLGIAQIMIDNPDFLILDEPFNGLDPEVKEQMLQLLVSLKNQGKGILLSTHLLEDIENIADEFILLQKGKVFMKGDMKIYRNERQSLTLYFSMPLDDFQMEGIHIDPSAGSMQLLASIEETEELLKQLYIKGMIPYRMNRSSILHDKYMEIVR
jgi:ABC-2 type transport system ATP-binding protein